MMFNQSQVANMLEPLEARIKDLEGKLEGAEQDVRALRQHNDVLANGVKDLQSRLDSVLAGVRWVISDMGYCPPELALQQGIVWHAKLSSLVVERGKTIG